MIDGSKIKRVVWSVKIGGINVGATKQGTARFRFGGQYQPVDDVDQVAAIVKEWEVGFKPTFEVTLKQADFETINGVLLRGRSKVVIDGAKRFYGLGASNKDLLEIAQPLILHPYDLPDDDLSQDWIFWLTAGKVENTEILGDRDNEQELVLSMTIYPDFTKKPEFMFGGFGDWTATDVAPSGIAIIMNDRANIPLKHLNALSLSQKAFDKLRAMLFYDTDGSVTMSINFGAGYTSTDTSLIFDGLSTPYAIQAGAYLKVDGADPDERMYVESVVYLAGGTAGTLTVNRAVSGFIAEALPDNTVLRLQTNVGVVDGTDYVDWESDLPADVTVGNSIVGTGPTKKGVVAWASTGAANITATLMGTVSPNTLITATAP